MIHFLEPSSDYLSIGDYLTYAGRALAHRFSMLHYEDLPAWRTAPLGTYVFAGLDQLFPGGRRLAAELSDQLAQSGEGVRFLNSPRQTLLRFELLQELHRRGLNSFRVMRALDDFRGLRYPVFVREEHGHNGALTPLLNTPEEVERGFGSSIARGRRMADLLVVEFSDTADADGFYRKYAAFVVGSEIMARSLDYGREWMLKAASTEYGEPMAREEQAYVFENPHERQLRSIFEIAHVEYGRIDYAVKDGRIETWEINLNPTLFGNRPEKSSLPREVQVIRRKTNDHFYRLFQQAWEAVDAGGEDLPPVPIRYSRESLQARIARVKKQSRWKRALRKRLRPLRPAVMSIGRTLSPILVRLARRAG